MENEFVVFAFSGVLPNSGRAVAAEYSFTLEQIPGAVPGTGPEAAVASYRMRAAVALGEAAPVTGRGEIIVDETAISRVDLFTEVDVLNVSFVQDAADAEEFFSFNLRFEAPGDTLDAPVLPGPAQLDRFEFVQGVFFEQTGMGGMQAQRPIAIDEVEGSTRTAPISAGVTVAQAQQVALIYEAARDRDGVIDEPGLNYWIDQREEGLSARALARVFLDSREFEASFGDPDTLTNEGLVRVLFENVLERAPDADGLGFWINELARPDFDRADLVLAFAAAPENVEGLPILATLAEVDDGRWAFLEG